MILSLVRFAYLPDMTLGYLVVAGARLATIEPPWLPNPNGPGGLPRDAHGSDSCVPDGDYRLEPHNTVDHPNVWALVNEQLGVYHQALPLGQHYGRTAVLIHSGNTTKDTQGCILVGLRHGSTDGRGTIDEVVDSRAALQVVQSTLQPGQHLLQIRPYPGTSAALWGV